jgi:hypothetical protein
MKARSTTVTLGGKVVLTGRVNKSAAGRLVILQQRPRAGTKWKKQGDALVHRDGHYRVSDRPTVNNRRMYRVVMPATKRHKKGVSESVVVHVFKWTALTSLPPVNVTYLGPELSVSMNGVAYPSSLEASIPHWEGAPTTQSIEYNVDRGCTRFRGTFGLADDSESGGRATVSATADGTPWFSQTFGLGESTPSAVTFASPPLKLRFETSSVIADTDGRGAVGTPEVYCEQ